MAETHVEPSYKTYWVAWLCLLFLTMLMVVAARPMVLIPAMVAKAMIIVLWFMHLRYERLGLTLSVLLGIFATGLLLFLLIVPDGMAM